MNILQGYFLRQVVSIFFITTGLFVGILFLGNMLKVMNLLTAGIGFTVIMKFLLYTVPFMLTYAIPMGILTATLLCFSRFSAENEITAVRASGISLGYIIRPVILFSFLLVIISFFNNTCWRPRANFKGRYLLISHGIDNPFSTIIPGRFNDLMPGYEIYVKEHRGETLYKLIIYKFQENNLAGIVTAERGYIIKKDLKWILLLKNGNVEDINQDGSINRIDFDTYNIVLGDVKSKNLVLMKKERERTNKELRFVIDDLIKKMQVRNMEFKQQITREISGIRTRIHNRIALSFASLIFAMIGIPSGLRLHRRETSAGVGVSLILIAAYYFLITLIESFKFTPEVYPWIMIWIPDVLFGMAAVILLVGLSKK